MSLRSHILIAAVALLWPAVALANPGPNPTGALILSGVFIVQVVTSIVLIATARDTSLRFLLLRVGALVCSMFGITVFGFWEAALIFQVPAAVLLLAAAMTSGGRSSATIGFFATLVTMVALPWGVKAAQKPWSMFGNATALGGVESTKLSGPPVRKRIENFAPVGGTDAGAEDAGAVR